MQQVFLVARIDLFSPDLLTRFELWKSDERNTPRVGRHAKPFAARLAHGVLRESGYRRLTVK